jgi:hypothetical protein
MCMQCFCVHVAEHEEQYTHILTAAYIRAFDRQGVSISFGITSNMNLHMM